MRVFRNFHTKSCFSTLIGDSPVAHLDIGIYFGFTKTRKSNGTAVSHVMGLMQDHATLVLV